MVCAWCHLAGLASAINNALSGPGWADNHMTIKSLQADASGGGTGIFVNGRELHAYDVLALQQITGPIMPGRYFITAEGLAGPEGGPALWNLRAMAAPAAGGGSNTWQSRITGASGFSDGNTGAVFLPNGGIVSYGN